MSVVIKKIKEKPLRKRHPWIFTGALLSKPDKCSGEILPVFTEAKELLGHAFCNTNSPTIFGRMVSWGDENPLSALKKSFDNAIYLRTNSHGSNAIRLIHAESDNLPGLVVDSYDNHFVIQVSTLGMEKIKKTVIEWLLTLNPHSIYEKSLSPSRKVEGLKPFEGQIFGTTPETIEIVEDGRKMNVHPKTGQKTGYFIDQRALRNAVRDLSSNKRVLNCFSYTGGFSIAALQGGAKQAISLDSSAWALEQAAINATLNGFNHETITADAFDYLTNEETLPFDLIILDPPAFAKSQRDIPNGYNAYKSINTLALKKMPPRSFLVSCSCSHFIDSQLFTKLLFESALQAKREIKVIQKIEASLDHPMSLFHPESHYLKSFCLYVI